jgi:hypothetical protein
VICHDGVVEQFWMTTKDMPTNGFVMEGATCTQSDGLTTMTYTRAAAADTEQLELVLTEGESTTLIWAYGSSSTMGYHGMDYRGAVTVDMVGGSQTVSKSSDSHRLAVCSIISPFIRHIHP